MKSEQVDSNWRRSRRCHTGCRTCTRCTASGKSSLLPSCWLWTAGRTGGLDRGKKNKSMFDISFGRCAVEGRVEAVPVAHQNSFKFPSHFYTSYRLQVTFVVYIITGLFVQLFVSSFKVLKLTYLCSSFYTYASTTPQPSLWKFFEMSPTVQHRPLGIYIPEPGYKQTQL